MLRPPLFSLLILLVLLGRWAAPSVDTSARLVAAKGDPVAQSDILLARTVDAPTLAAQIDTALAAGDPDLADSFVALADRQRVTVDPARRAAVAAANQASIAGSGATFLRGAVMGDAEGAAGLAGAFAGDLVGIGDVRDLGREGWRMLQGEEPDRLIMGLAAAGLAVTAATFVSAGETAPVRGGLTVIKALRRSGRLTAGMTAALGRLLRAGVDGARLEAGAKAFARLDLAEGRRALAEAVRPGALAPLAAVGRDGATLIRRAGTRGLDEAMSLARSPKELGRAARLSETMGRATRATLKILGRSALILADGIAVLASWLFAAAFYLLAIAIMAARFGRRLARATRRRRPRKATSRPAPDSAAGFPARIVKDVLLPTARPGDPVSPVSPTLPSALAA
jgi:hypothetical protein